MTEFESNVGESGIASIRIGGRRVEGLSRVEQMMARKQIELSEEEKRVRDIRARYPKYKVVNLKSSIKEMDSDIRRFEDAITDLRGKVADFTGFLALCEQRDKELKAAGVEA